MIGVFNMVEGPLDRSTSSSRCLMGLKEELTWEDIKNKCNIEDFFRRDDGPIYSWITYMMMGLWFLQGWIDFMRTLARCKVHFLILWIIKFSKILLSRITTQLHFLLILALAFQVDGKC